VYCQTPGFLSATVENLATVLKFKVYVKATSVTKLTSTVRFYRLPCGSVILDSISRRAVKGSLIVVLYTSPSTTGKLIVM